MPYLLGGKRSKDNSNVLYSLYFNANIIIKAVEMK